MEEGRKPYTLMKGLLDRTDFIVKEINFRDCLTKPLENFVSIEHDTDGVTESRMLSTGESIKSEAELLDPTEPLVERCVDNFPLKACQVNKSVEGIENDFSFGYVHV